MPDDDLTWAPLGDADFDDLVALAACLRADGGLPLAAEPGLYAALGRGRHGEPGRARREGCVGRRGRGAAHGAGRGRDGHGAGRPGDQTPGVRSGAARLGTRRGGPAGWAGRGRVRVADSGAGGALRLPGPGAGVRRGRDADRPGLPVPPAVWPGGTTLHEWTAEVAPRFFAVYQAAFRERPGFPGEPAEEWISDVADDEEFRPGWSVLAEVPGIGDAGFVTGAVGWIVQVGVLPAARGKGLGAALVRESLGRMVADGAVEAWLDVNVNNAAINLYRRLGFRVDGRRARYQPICGWTSVKCSTTSGGWAKNRPM